MLDERYRRWIITCMVTLAGLMANQAPGQWNQWRGIEDRGTDPKNDEAPADTDPAVETPRQELDPEEVLRNPHLLRDRRRGTTAQVSRYHPRPAAEIRSTLREIENRRAADYRNLARRGTSGSYPADHIQALNRLNAYRYLVGLPHDVTLDDGYTQLAQAAAEICQRIGRLDHHPPNPGMREAEYRLAAQGAGRSNLYMGGQAAASIDAYMDDSDPSNIDRVGHRRWCLNPAMAKTGFGVSGRFSAMYAMDNAGGRFNEDFIAFPAQGYMPVGFFSPNHAWSVQLNSSRFQAPDPRRVSVKIHPLPGGGEVDLDRRRAPLELNYFNVETGGFGWGYAIIFRPENLSVAAGRRYWVEIEGLRGSSSRLGYLVEFTN